jgi:hypothetical protein
VGISVFHDCYFDPFLPETIEDRVRSCNSIAVVRQIHQQWTTLDFKHICFDSLSAAGTDVSKFSAAAQKKGPQKILFCRNNL